VSTLIALFWPAALVVIAVLGYRFGHRVLGHLAAQAERNAVTTGHVVELNALKSKVAELNAAVIQLNNARAMTAPRRPGSI
jgi:hypothetical protein